MATFKEIWRILKYFYAGAAILAVLFVLYRVIIAGTERNYVSETVFYADEVMPYTPQIFVHEEYHAYAEQAYQYDYTAYVSAYPIVHYIPWSFAAYEEPCFGAAVMQEFEAGYVTITMHCPDNEGWALISSIGGDYWVYLNSNRRFIRRKMGLFEYKGEHEPVAFLDSQLVDVLDINENWLLVDTEYGEKWLNLDFMPSTGHLSSFLRPFDNQLSVYYRNMETGFSFVFNTGRRYFSASTKKAPFALYLYERAERGEISMSDYYYSVKFYLVANFS